MTQINPFVSTFALSLAGLQQAAETRDARLKRARVLLEAPGRLEADIDHVVETANAVSAVGDSPDDAPREQPKPKHPAEEPPHIDVEG